MAKNDKKCCGTCMHSHYDNKIKKLRCHAISTSDNIVSYNKIQALCCWQKRIKWSRVVEHIKCLMCNTFLEKEEMEDLHYSFILSNERRPIINFKYKCPSCGHIMKIKREVKVKFTEL